MKKGDKQTIAPGQSFTLTLDWTIKLAQSDFTQSAEFRTTDPRREIVRLLIHGRTVEAVEFMPASLQNIRWSAEAAPNSAASSAPPVQLNSSA